MIGEKKQEVHAILTSASENIGGQIEQARIHFDATSTVIMAIQGLISEVQARIAGLGELLRGTDRAMGLAESHGETASVSLDAAVDGTNNPHLRELGQTLYPLIQEARYDSSMHLGSMVVEVMATTGSMEQAAAHLEAVHGHVANGHESAGTHHQNLSSTIEDMHNQVDTM